MTQRATSRNQETVEPSHLYPGSFSDVLPLLIPVSCNSNLVTLKYFSFLKMISFSLQSLKRFGMDNGEQLIMH